MVTPRTARAPMRPTARVWGSRIVFPSVVPALGAGSLFLPCCFARAAASTVPYTAAQPASQQPRSLHFLGRGVASEDPARGAHAVVEGIVTSSSSRNDYSMMVLARDERYQEANPHMATGRGARSATRRGTSADESQGLGRAEVWDSVPGRPVCNGGQMNHTTSCTTIVDLAARLFRSFVSPSSTFTMTSGSSTAPPQAEPPRRRSNYSKDDSTLSFGSCLSTDSATQEHEWVPSPTLVAGTSSASRGRETYVAPSAMQFQQVRLFGTSYRPPAGAKAGPGARRNEDRSFTDSSSSGGDISMEEEKSGSHPHQTLQHQVGNNYLLSCREKDRDNNNMRALAGRQPQPPREQPEALRLNIPLGLRWQWRYDEIMTADEDRLSPFLARLRRSIHCVRRSDPRLRGISQAPLEPHANAVLQARKVLYLAFAEKPKLMTAASFGATAGSFYLQASRQPAAIDLVAQMAKAQFGSSSGRNKSDFWLTVFGRGGGELTVVPLETLLGEKVFFGNMYEERLAFWRTAIQDIEADIMAAADEDEDEEDGDREIRDAADFVRVSRANAGEDGDHGGSSPDDPDIGVEMWRASGGPERGKPPHY